MKTITISQPKLASTLTYSTTSVLVTMIGPAAVHTLGILLVLLNSHVAATTMEVTKFYSSWSNVKFGGAETCVTDSDIANIAGIVGNVRQTRCSRG